jgi:hypothetical protein
MPITFPRFRTMDYGNIMANAEATKRMRLGNEILGMDNQEQQNIIANRERANQIRAQVDGMPAQIEQLEAAGLMQEADELRNSYITTRMNSVQMLEAMRDAITEENYKQVRQDLIQAGAIDGSMWPTEYSDRWFREQVERQRSDLTRLTRQWGDAGRVMAQDLVTRDGEILWEGEPYETTESFRARTRAGDEDPWAIEAADTNSIRSAAADLFDGFYNPVSGRYEGLDDPERSQIASIAEEASRIYASGQGQIPHSRAVAEAARKLGIEIPSLENPADPLGIFGAPGQQ